jgi:hypothetical protein
MTGSDEDLHLVGISLDCADPAVLAAFYRELLDGELVWSKPGSAGVKVRGGAVLVAQRVPDYAPPQWPGTAIVHLDLAAGNDIEGPIAFALKLGAVRADHQPNARWCVLIDPAGHPFCITTVTAS